MSYRNIYGYDVVVVLAVTHPWFLMPLRVRLYFRWLQAWWRARYRQLVISDCRQHLFHLV